MLKNAILSIPATKQKKIHFRASTRNQRTRKARNNLFSTNCPRTKEEAYLQRRVHKEYEKPQVLQHAQAFCKANMTGIILAGGYSKRLGQTKALLPYAGRTLVEHSLRLLHSLFSEVILVVKDPNEFKHLAANLVKDILPEKGPMAAILSGLLAAGQERAFVMPCNMPLIDSEVLACFLAAPQTKSVHLYESSGGLNPLLGFYSKSALEHLEELMLDGNKNTQAGLSPEIVAGIKLPERLRRKSEFCIESAADYAKLLSGAIY